ncbi:RNA methyltransferase [Kamptonema cortianum]|nr:RNA methyltransferase [Kamptonema cortianum]
MDVTALARVKIILVEPAGALNVGAIARVMKNLGLSQLVLVNPRCDRASGEARQMAVHAADLLEAAEVVNSLPEALKGCQRAIATTARARALETPLEAPRSTLGWLLEAPSALIFGREDRGLTNEELNYAQRFVRIPSSEAYPSLNLAQSVAICCYELSQSARGEASESANPLMKKKSISSLGETASLENLERYYQQLESVLLKIGYLYPHTVASRMEKFRRLYNRTYLTDNEVAMLRGVLSQVEWAIAQQERSPSESFPFSEEKS